MLACRLCLALGIDDPEAWLEQASRRQLALWQAFYQVEPWGAEFERSANVSSLLSAQTAFMVTSHGGKPMKVQPVSDFMPTDWINAPKPKTKKPITSEKAAQRTEKVLAAFFPTADSKKRIVKDGR